LPSSRALAENLGLARTTVTEAYGQLELEGYLVARRGAGTWVADLAAAPRRRASVPTSDDGTRDRRRRRAEDFSTPDEPVLFQRLSPTRVARVVQATATVDP
jgi:DNA-binding GntR family transcriptional regulator